MENRLLQPARDLLASLQRANIDVPQLAIDGILGASVRGSVKAAIDLELGDVELAKNIRELYALAIAAKSWL